MKFTITRLLQILSCLFVLTFLLPILSNLWSNNSNILSNDQPSYKQFKSKSIDDNESVSSIFDAKSSLSLEEQLSYRFVDLKNRIKYNEMIANDRRKQIYELLYEIRKLWILIKQNSYDNHTDKNISNKSLANLNDLNQTISLENESILLPSLLDLWPHLMLSSTWSLNPTYHIKSKIILNQPKRRFVFGIPTVKRLVESYLISTLKNLIENLTPNERNQSLFFVFVAENDEEFFNKTSQQILNNFHHEIDQGLIEIISPPDNYYPNFSLLKPTLGDTIERVKWRSKQNFDFAYLMMFCRSRGQYYIQLEDDIISKKSYLTKMEGFIAKNALLKKDWLLLDFCQLGFIGKLFRTIDLSQFILFFAMFHNDKPVDWLLDNFIQTKVCRFDKDTKDCKKQKSKLWLEYKPSLFQHVGTYSSLKGKIQKLKVKNFGKIKLYEPHYDNPPVDEYYSTIKSYLKHNIQSAYEGRTYYWGMTPKKNDIIGFKYKPPGVNIESIRIKSGNIEHPSDLLLNATLQLKSSKYDQINRENYQIDEKDHFISLTEFDSLDGSLAIEIPKELNPILEIRIHIDNDLINWIIINEIQIKEIAT